MNAADFTECNQQDIITAPAQERILVNAGPGTGKTYTVIERIKHLIACQNISPEEILVLCFSRAAVSVIKNRLGKQALAVEARTFDSFASCLLYQIPEEQKTIFGLDTIATLNYDERIEKATAIFTKYTNGDDNNHIPKACLLDSYKHIFIDEIQDLVSLRAEFVFTLLRNIALSQNCGITLLGDSCQAIYDYIATQRQFVWNSDDFYNNIFRLFPNIQKRALTENHRQDTDFQNRMTPYRDAILSENLDTMNVELQNLMNTIQSANIRLDTCMSHDFASYITNKRTLGILTRTNGQALQISHWFKKNKIPHMLQRKTNEATFANWIYMVLANHNGQTIGEDDFIRTFKAQYPTVAQHAPSYWKALVEDISPNGRYEISDILMTILKNAKNTLLTAGIGYNPNRSIVISNIHRAKGMEFDSVLVLSDIYANNNYYQNIIPNQNELCKLEHKVRYVSLTRPKTRIETVSLRASDKKIRILQASRRCYRKNLFEIGFARDFDIYSFAKSQDAQAYMSKLNPADITSKRFLLRKAEKEECKQCGYIRYYIVPEEKPDIELGYTTDEFDTDLKAAYACLLRVGRGMEVEYDDVPQQFSDIYADRVVTYIAANNQQIEGALQYNAMSVWLGLTLSGFASAQK